MILADYSERIPSCVGRRIRNIVPASVPQPSVDHDNPQQNLIETVYSSRMLKSVLRTA
jgi:hypothetical protein